MVTIKKQMLYWKTEHNIDRYSLCCIGKQNTI